MSGRVALLGLAGLALLAGCSSRVGPNARELSDLVINPDVGFTVSAQALAAGTPEPSPDSAISGFQSLGCTSSDAQTASCRFSLVLYDPLLPDDKGQRYTAQGTFVRKGTRWTAAQDAYLLTPATPPEKADSGG